MDSATPERPSDAEERLAAALDDCRARLARGETLGRCLAAHPDEAEALTTLAPFLTDVAALRQEPAAAYSHAARVRFHQRLAEERARQAAGRSRLLVFLRRAAIPVAAVVALAGSGVGLVTASADALPGSALYPIQLAHDQVVQRLALTPEQQVATQWRLANRRLEQVRQAAQRHASAAVVDELTARMLAATQRGAVVLAQLPEPKRQQGLARVAPILQQEDAVLNQERTRAIAATPNLAAQRQRQLLAVERQLALQQGESPATPQVRPAPGRQSGGRLEAPASVSGIGSANLASPSRVAPRATTTAASRPTPSRAAALTRIERVRRLLVNWRGGRRFPVHTPTP